MKIVGVVMAPRSEGCPLVFKYAVGKLEAYIHCRKEGNYINRVKWEG